MERAGGIPLEDELSAGVHVKAVGLRGGRIRLRRDDVRGRPGQAVQVDPGGEREAGLIQVGRATGNDDTLAGGVVELEGLSGDSRAVSHATDDRAVADSIPTEREVGVGRVAVGLEIKGGNVGRAGAVDEDAVTGISADDVGRARGGSADGGVQGRPGDVDPGTRVGQRAAAVGLDADVVPFDRVVLIHAVVGRAVPTDEEKAATDQDSIPIVAADNVASGGRRAADGDVGGTVAEDHRGCVRGRRNRCRWEWRASR